MASPDPSMKIEPIGSAHALGIDEGRRPRAIDYLKSLGPGVISGASDNDPTTVATLSVIGGSTIYGLSWLTILLFPMLATIQAIAARIGVVTHRGLQRVVYKEYGRVSGIVLLTSVLVVNAITIGADLEGGAAAIGLIFGKPWQWFVIPFAGAVVAMLVLGSYGTVQRILKYVIFVFVAYIVSTFAAHPAWGTVLHSTFHPSISMNSVYVQGALSLLGTTLTSYAYVWESIEEAEERPPIRRLGLAQADAGFGMLFAVAIFWFILIGTGATLGVHGHQVQTAQDAAEALKPIAGPAAGYLFATGLLASAFLAVPVLIATSAYMICQEFGWRGGLSESPWRARPFYIAMVGAVLIGITITFLGISPIQLLFWSGIAGGLGTPISLVFLLLVARNRRIMGEYVIGKLFTVLGWATTALVTAISAYFLWQQVFSTWL
ncbi:MAG: divalent metal cation transporter [Chloroflexota bacterium]